MHKFIKISVSILLVISIVLNPFAPVFDINSEALATEIVLAIGYVCCGIAVGSAVGLLSSMALEMGDDFQSWCGEVRQDYVDAVDNLFQSGNAIIFPNYEHGDPTSSDYYFTTGNAYVNPDLGLSGLELEIAQSIADGINERVDNGTNLSLIADENPLTGQYYLTSDTYDTLKGIVMNAMSKQITNDYVEANRELSSALAEAGAPFYDFDFVGPMPSLTTNSIERMAAFNASGFYYSLPVTVNLATQSGSSYISFTKTQIETLYNSQYTSLRSTDGLWLFSGEADVYGGCQYILYDGKIYYDRWSTHYDEDGDYSQSRFGYINPFRNDLEKVSKYWVSADGSTLADTDFDLTKTVQMGYTVNVTGEYASGTPLVTSNPATSEDSFKTTVGGTTEIPRTEAEQTIGNALGLGLINPDSALEIGEDGSIVSADGIELAKLQELIDLISEGNLNFEDIESYLNLITQLVGAGNMTATEQTAILNNIKALEKSQTKTIEEINTAVTAIAAALTIEGEIELETPDVTIIDKFPFCLPFDLYYVFSLLCAEPKEPVFEIPIKTTIETGGLNYEIDEKIVLDLTIFRLNGCDMVQIFTQTSVTLLFVICLIGATKKLMWS